MSEELTGEEIMKRVDKNRFYEEIEYKGKMIIRKGDKVRTKQMHVYAQGEEKALIEFTNPSDMGTKYLKLGDEMWVYFPDAEDEVKISGHMLRESMMGSDFSYEDIMENKKLLEKYSVEVVGSEVVDNRDCYILELNAIDKDVTYAKRKSWVDKEKFVILKAQLFALSGKLLKEVEMKEIQQYDDRYFATKVIMRDKVMKDTSTTFEMEDIDFDADIPDNNYSRRRLQR
jgi:outer membrane lipoprotein-sorting protein